MAPNVRLLNLNSAVVFSIQPRHTRTESDQLASPLMRTRLRTATCVALSLGFVGLAQTVHAEKMHVAMSVDLKTYQSRATFERSQAHPGEEWMYLTTASDDVEFHLRMQMTGQQDVVQKGRTTVNEVPGITEGVTGYKRARVESFGNEIVLVIESKFTRLKKDDGKQTEEKVDTVDRIPLVFRDKSLTVADLKSGRPAQLRITSDGLKAMLKTTKEKSMADLSFKAEGKGSRVSASAFSRLLDSRKKGAVFLSADRIEYEAPALHAHAEGKLRLNMKD